jgi:hypothetical protein
MSKRLLIILMAALVFAAAAKAQTGPSFTSVTLPAGEVTVPYGADLQVSGGTPPYTFTLATGSTLPAGFTLAPTANGNVAAGHISNNSPAAAGTFSFGVTVTDSNNLSATATISLTINPAPTSTAAQLALLNGQYALLFRGSDDSNGSVNDNVASFNFDGAGNFNVFFDGNGSSNGVQEQCTASGTYSVGADNRGLIRITTNGTCVIGSEGGGGGGTFAFALGDVKNGVASTARVIDFENNGTGNNHGQAGLLRRQNPAAFTSASLAGTYVLGLTGQDTSLGRAVEVALATFDGSLAITSGILDQNDNGTLNSATFSGSYTAPDANGRSVLTVTVVAAGGNFTSTSVIYIVSANEMFLMTLDPATTNLLFAGDGERQFNPNSFALNSLAGPDILNFNGTSSGGTNAGVGVLTASVVNNVGNFSVTADSNDGGNLKLAQVLNGTYTMASNGRAVVTGQSGSGNVNLIVYLIQQDRAFFIGEDSSDPPFGQVEPQVGAPFPASPASPFANNLFFGEDELVPNGKEDNSGVAVLAPSSVLNVTADNSHSGGDLTFGQSISLSYTVDSTGHFTTTPNGTTGGLTGYVVSPFKVEFFDTSGPTSDPAPSVHPSLIIAQSIPQPPGVPSPATTTVNFAAPVAVGNTAQSAPVTFTNTGVGPLTLQTLTNAADFSAAGTCVNSLPVVLAPGQTCQVVITFAPGATTTLNTPLNETITIATDAGNITITATGTAVGGTVAVAPGSLTFGAQVVNTTSASQPVTVTANSAASVAISAVSVPTGFTETDNCKGVTLVPNTNTSSCTINVTFAPTTVGPFSGNLSITDTAGGSPQTVALTGTSVSGQFTVAPAALNFGTVVINTTSPAQIVTVTNGTVQNQFILSIVPPASFAETDNCVAGGAPLAPGASCTINVTFTPTSATAFSGNLAITAGPQNSPPPTLFNVALTGNGTISTFTLALAPGSSSSVTVVPGGTAAYGILVTGTPGINQTINFTASTTSNTITVTVTPQSVTITGTGNTQFALVLQTFCRKGGIGPNPQVPGGGLKLLLLAMALAAMAWVYRRRPRWALSFALLMLIAIGGAACGGDPGANGPTPPGTYPVTLTATSGQQVQTLNLTLIVQ